MKKNTQNLFHLCLVVVLACTVSLCKDKGTGPGSDKDAAAPREKLFIYTKTNLHLREQADKNSKSLGLLERGVEIDLIEKTTVKHEAAEGIPGEWWKVESKGMTGYVFSGYLSKFRPTKQECHGIEGYLKDVYGELDEKNTNMSQFKREEGKCNEDHQDMESCKITMDFTLKNGIDAKLQFGHEWMGEEVFFPGIRDQEAYLILRDCCGKEKPFTYKQFMEALDAGKKIPPFEMEYFQECKASRAPGGIKLGQDSGV